ncbi:MAG: SDR family oxidoreductase [Candidatus Omnitrophica bacterium]|nr:SDR family oxidoreductase [Candidatus Omnitrophota bacterium]
MRLKEKRAIITGGGTGIGESIAQRFAEEGAKVLITGRREDKLMEAAKGNPNIRILSADLTAPEGPKEIVDAAVETLGGIDILVNNAGAFEAIPIEESDDGVYDRQFEVNVRGLYRMSQAALPELKKNVGANIVNIGSILSFIGIPGTSVYAASKGAVAQITRSFAVEVGGQGIRCNCVCPGLVHTDLTDFMISDPEFVKENLPAYPIGRFGKTVDIGNACVFLASEEAAWITGVILPVDGGYTAR